MITYWEKLRIWLLAGTCGSIVFTCIFSIIDLAQSKKSSFWELPSQSTILPKWQLSSSQSIIYYPQPINDQPVAPILGRRYQYINNSQRLDIEMRYLIYTNVGVIDILKTYTSLKVSPDQIKVIHQPRIGDYGLFIDNKKAYLSACIHVNGGSTFTKEQLHNRHKAELEFNHLSTWVMGLNKLHDWRCLWVLMSTPLENKSASSAFSTLTAVWTDWNQWWVTHFPKDYQS